MGDVNIGTTWDESVSAIEAINIAIRMEQQQSALNQYSAAKYKMQLSGAKALLGCFLIAMLCTIRHRMPGCDCTLEPPLSSSSVFHSEVCPNSGMLPFALSPKFCVLLARSDIL